MGRSIDLPWSVAAVAAGLIIASGGSAAAQEAEEPADRLASRPGWSKGPVAGALGDQATIDVPQGYYFLDAAATRRFLTETENVPDGDELGAVVHKIEGGGAWFAIFSFSNEGYVSDTDKDAIDADALMKGMKAGNERANEERQKRGWSTMTLEGWHKPPYYDQTTHNLTWAIRGASPGDGTTINHSVRLLGRRGVMSVALVTGQEHIGAATGDFDQLLTGFAYNPGQRYAEFRNGDKMAGYGLAALIGGGAAAAAVKTGFLGKAWKAIVALVVAAAGALRKLFGGGRSEPEAASVQPPPVP
jgi:uncharacterized membrane-anchored protein